MGHSAAGLARLRTRVETFFDTKLCFLFPAVASSGHEGKPYTALIVSGSLRQEGRHANVATYVDDAVHIDKPWKASCKWDTNTIGAIQVFNCGLDGSAFMGDWNAATAYVAGKIVEFSSFFYVALANTTGNRPDQSPAKWRVCQPFKILSDNRANDTRARLIHDVKELK